MTSDVTMGDGERTAVSSSGVNGGTTPKQPRQIIGERKLPTPVDAQMGGVQVATPEPPSMLSTSRILLVVLL